MPPEAGIKLLNTSTPKDWAWAARVERTNERQQQRDSSAVHFSRLRKEHNRNGFRADIGRLRQDPYISCFRQMCSELNSDFRAAGSGNVRNAPPFAMTGTIYPIVALKVGRIGNPSTTNRSSSEYGLIRPGDVGSSAGGSQGGSRLSPTSTESVSQ